MKRICLLIMSLFFVFSSGFVVFAQEMSQTAEYLSEEELYYCEILSQEEIYSYSEDYSEDESVSVYFPEADITTSSPVVEITTMNPGLNGDTISGAWENFQHVSVTFFISTNSLATVSYHAVAQKSGNIEATVYFEKQVFGSKWERVNIGTNGNKLTNRTNGYYISGTETVKVSGEGTYRVVVTVKNSYGSASASNSFVFSKSSSLADVNNDGYINATDARLALRFSAGLQKYSSSQKTRCDVNGDGSITAADARIILRIAAKLM